MAVEFEVVESQQSSLNISKDEASLLSAMGREMASNQIWWGSSQAKENRSVIDVKPATIGGYEVVFREVIGVVQLGEVRIKVIPKIPWEHFFFIASRSEFCPRLSSGIANVEVGFEFLAMLCRWFVDSAERLIRVGMRREFAELTLELGEVRGTLLPLATAIEVLKGRPVASCSFDELSIDTPLNRIVRAGCERVSVFEGIPNETRKRARRAAFRMDGVGLMTHSDRRIKPDRLSKNYLHPISLASLILDGSGISLSDGQTVGTSFLLRTPEIIEDGIRSIIADGFPAMSVKKRRQMLGDSGLSMNPDIVFGDNLAIADVKYKFLGRDWNRNDFNQIVAFATAFQSKRCALFGFSKGLAEFSDGHVSVGSIEAARMAWSAGGERSPEQSSQALLQEITNWLKVEGKTCA
jgi:5-methylcytosine-specific restriction enzyme subunit McrC